MRKLAQCWIVLAAALAAPPAFADIVVLRTDGTPATNDEMLIWQDSAGGWHIVLQALYAPGGVTLYEIRGDGGETIERIIIHVPCWQGPGGQCVPAGSPVFVRVLSYPPLGVKTVHSIVQSGTAETLLTHVIVNEDIGEVDVQAIGILNAGRDVVGPVRSFTPDNPMRGIGEVHAGRHILGDLTAMAGKVAVVHAGASIGQPDSPINIRFKYDTLDIRGQEIHADVDARIGAAAGGTGSIWRFEADRFFGSLETPRLEYHGKSGAPASVRVREEFAGSMLVGESLNDPAHRIELPVNGFTGQLVVNADNAGGTWTAPVHIGAMTHPDHTFIVGPTYSKTSAQLGGGAIGLVPFRLHHGSSSPASGSVVNVASGDDPGVVMLEHYGPIEIAGGNPLAIARRPIGESTAFQSVSLAEFSVNVVESDTKTLRIEPSPFGSGFEPGYEYRILPTTSLRSHTAGSPAVIWSAPYHVTIAIAPAEPEEPEEPHDPDEPECLGDVNGDGVVDIFDLLAILASWGPCPAETCTADVDGDGAVDIFDLLAVLANWGPCIGGGVPGS